MATVICPKCKQAVVAPEGRDYVICCNEVIYVISETYNRKTEGEADDYN